MDISYNNLDKTEMFSKLLQSPPYTYEDFTVSRIKDFDISSEGYRYNFAGKAINNNVLSLLYELAEEQQIIKKYTALAEGKIMNTGEERMVLHHALRGTLTTPVVKDGRNYHEFYSQQRSRIKDFSQKIRAGTIKGCSGASFDSFVQIGIGGSDLGPKALYIALEQYVRIEKKEQTRYKTRFISNVDPDDASVQLAGLNPETTLFILVSKSGTNAGNSYQ